MQRRSDGSFTGSIKTLSVKAEIQIMPNRGKVGEQPDYRVLTGGVELGGGWTRIGEVSQREYVRLAMSAPELGARTLYPISAAPPVRTTMMPSRCIHLTATGFASSFAHKGALTSLDNRRPADDLDR